MLVFVPSPTTLVFYDGLCGLCDRFVHFLLTRDAHGVLRFAPLQGDLARRELVARGCNPEDLDTVYVIAGWGSQQPRLLARSRAILHASTRLGGGWAIVAHIARLVPTPLADRIYTFVARRRYRLFGRYDACPLPRPEWRERFLD